MRRGEPENSKTSEREHSQAGRTRGLRALPRNLEPAGLSGSPLGRRARWSGWPQSRAHSASSPHGSAGAALDLRGRPFSNSVGTFMGHQEQMLVFFTEPCRLRYTFTLLSVMPARAEWAPEGLDRAVQRGGHPESGASA